MNAYKFQRAKAMASELAELIASTLPRFPNETIITSVPTLPAHIRKRGYDHAALLARFVAQQCGFRYIPLLERVKNNTQHTAISRAVRATQAEGTYVLRVDASSYDGRPILLIEDIITTGATVISAAKVLKKLNSPLFVAALAYQTLDE